MTERTNERINDWINECVNLFLSELSYNGQQMLQQTTMQVQGISSWIQEYRPSFAKYGATIKNRNNKLHNTYVRIRALDSFMLLRVSYFDMKIFAD